MTTESFRPESFSDFDPNDRPMFGEWVRVRNVPGDARDKRSRPAGTTLRLPKPTAAASPRQLTPVAAPPARQGRHMAPMLIAGVALVVIALVGPRQTE